MANMWMAIFADVGVMILAVLNAIRALFVKKNYQRRGHKMAKINQEEADLCCDSCEVHENLVKIVNETMPDDDIDGSVLGDITILVSSIMYLFRFWMAGMQKVAAFQRLLEKQELQKVVMRMQQVVVPDHAYDSAEMMQLAGRLVGI